MIVRSFIFPNLLGPTNYGAYSMASYFASIVVPFAVLGIPSAYSRYIPEFEKDGVLGDVLKKTFLFLVGTNLAIMAIVMSFAPVIARLLYGGDNGGNYNTLIMLTAAVILPLTLSQALTTAFNGMRVFRMATITSVARDIFGFILGVTFLLLIGRTAESLISSSFFSYFIPFAVMGWLLRRYIVVSGQGINSAPPAPELLRRILRYSKWFIGTPLVMAMFRMTDRWMIRRFVGLDAVGVYSVAQNITMPIYQMGMIVSNVLMPNLSSLWSADKKDEAVKTMETGVKFTTLVLFSIALFVSAIKRPLISLLFRDEYLPAVGVINFALSFFILRSIHSVLGSYAGLIEKTIINFTGAGVTFISAVGFNALLTPRFGIKGAAISTALAALIGLWTLLLLSARSGYKVPAVVLAMTFLPCILMLGVLPAALIFAVVLFFAVHTEWLFDEHEKERIANLVRRFWVKATYVWMKMRGRGGEE